MRRIVIYGLRIVLGVVFVAAALEKIPDTPAFLLSIRNYGLLPVPMAAILALFLPWLELCVGFCVLVGINVRGGSIILFVLLLIFIGAIASAMLRGLDIECGCFGGASDKVGTMKLLEDFLLLAATGGLYFFSRPASRLLEFQVPKD